jgi:hypothetical protein
MVNLAVLGLGRGPGFPAIGLVEDEIIFSAIERGFGGLVGFEAVEIFQEQQPGRLLGVIEFRGAAGFLAQHVVNIPEGLFKHERASVRGKFGSVNSAFIIAAWIADVFICRRPCGNTWIAARFCPAR